MVSQVIAGGWKIDIAVQAFPQKVASYGLPVLQDLVGVDYNAVAYLGSQVVNGINHAILVQAKVVAPDALTTLKVAVLHEKPIDAIKSEFSILGFGDPILTYRPGLAGGITAPVSFIDTAKEAAELWEKCEKPLGMHYETACVLGTQVVAGVKTAILAEAAPVVPEATKKAVVMYIWTKVDGEVVLDSVEDISMQVD
jgi:hypothetical protein